MPPPPKVKPSASIVHEPHDVLELFERRIEWAERFGAHHGSAKHHEAGSSGEGQIAIVGGNAAAAGQDTLTAGLVQNFAEDKNGYSIIVGDAIFEASAQSLEPGAAIATASTFLAVAGADFIIKYESSHGGLGPNDAWASSELYYVALDIKGWSPGGGPVVRELHHRGHHFQPSGHEPSDGNYAHVIATAESHGADSLSATLTNALTIENQFSFVNAIGVVAV
jgi:hypothetical protein